MAAIVLGLAGYVLYLSFHYYLYNGYQKYLTADAVFEKGREFKALADNGNEGNGMVLAAENEYLKLYTDTATTEIAVYDKRSGETIYSNPSDRAQDAIATGSNKVDLNSQFVLTYYDSTMTQATMYSYDYSVERKQYELESIKDGLRYTYLCGNLESATGIVPKYITKERLEEKILKKLTRLEASKVKNSYVKSTGVNGFLELTAGAQASKIGLSKLNKYLEKAGYTSEDYDADMAAAAGGKLPEKTTFTIPLEYRLQGDKLVVTVPVKQIKETGSGRLGSIALLSYLGAGSSNESGYLFVPNGSGSLIYFNNGKQTAERYNQYIYGMDETAQSYYQVEETEKARMPVFGIKHEKEAVFAEITGGDSLANIIAEVSGNTNSYNYVYPNFELRGSLKVSVLGVEGVSADLPTLEKNLYDTNLEVTYSFLTGENATIGKMAGYYREELIGRGELAKKETEASLPFYLDIVGGVKMQKSILGVPYLAVYPMTTFQEAQTITDRFFDKDISNLRVNYLGWFNGGYYHDAIERVKVDRKLGSKKSLAALNQRLEKEGGRLYGDVAVQKVSYKAKHTNYMLESAKRYAGYPVFYGRVNPATLRDTSSLGYEESIYSILSPKYLGREVDQFIKSVDRVRLSGISLRDLGDTITADKRRTQIINREEAKEIIRAQLKALQQTKDYLMISGGNAYSWAYASDLTNTPEGDNPFYIVDEEVPFYQMVIHGCIDYSSTAVNLSASYEEQEVILHMIEYGEAPHFTLSYRESSAMKYSGLNTLYSTQYQNWMEDADTIYQKVNAALKYVVNSTVTDYEILQNGVKKITYDNGVIFYINEGSSAALAQNIAVPAKSYVMEGITQ